MSFFFASSVTSSGAAAIFCSVFFCASAAPLLAAKKERKKKQQRRMAASEPFTMDTETFTVVKLQNSSHVPVYHYMLKPHVKANKEELKALTESLAAICNAPNQRSSVILDCSPLPGLEAVQRILKLNLQKSSSRIGNAGLCMFVLVTKQKLFCQAAEKIISFKDAAD